MVKARGWKITTGNLMSDAGLLIEALSFAGCCILNSVSCILYSEYWLLVAQWRNPEILPNS